MRSGDNHVSHRRRNGARSLFVANRLPPPAAAFSRTGAVIPEALPAIRLLLPRIGEPLPRIYKERPRVRRALPRLGKSCRDFETSCRDWEGFCREFDRACPQFEWSRRGFENPCREFVSLCLGSQASAGKQFVDFHVAQRPPRRAKAGQSLLFFPLRSLCPSREASPLSTLNLEPQTLNLDPI